MRRRDFDESENDQTFSVFRNMVSPSDHFGPDFWGY
jgi:hypothetical protein